MAKRLLIGVALVLLGSLIFSSLASAKAPITVKVAISEFNVEMSATDLPSGAPVKYVITNNGKLTHEIVLEREGVVDVPIEFDKKGQEAEDIEPGTTRTVEWTIPEAGKYQLACHITGHYEAGMKTIFTAASAPASAAAPAPATAPAPAVVPSQLPQTGGAEIWRFYVLGLLALLVLGGGLLLRLRKA